MKTEDIVVLRHPMKITV